MANYTDEQVAEACAVLSKDAGARQTLVEMWAGKRRNVFKGAVERLAEKIGGSASYQEGTVQAMIFYLGDKKRVKIDLLPVPRTFGMLDVTMLMEGKAKPNGIPQFYPEKNFREELGEAFPSDQLVSELFLMKEFAE